MTTRPGPPDRRCLFHIPLAIDPRETVGSQLRPQRMRAGFREIGYQVDTIWGSAAERKQQIQAVKRNVESGIHYDFVYSETSTMPTLLTEYHHLPTNPLVDFLFFRTCQKSRIPLGLFYRDVYWQFELYRHKIAWHKRSVTIPLYHLDLFVYRYLVDILFLPSQRMSKLIPYWPHAKPIYDLPPGGVLYDEGVQASDKPVLRLFYVGAVGPPLYDIGNLLEGVYRAVQADAQIQLTICCPESDWLERPRQYDNWLGDWLRVVHLSGKETQKLYKRQDVAIVYRVPSAYLEFAMPVKVFEALGHGKPILTMNGTVVSDFVQENQCGWSISPDPAELAQLLCRLANGSEEVEAMTRIACRVRLEHTWARRAERVASILTAAGSANRRTFQE